MNLVILLLKLILDRFQLSSTIVPTLLQRVHLLSPLIAFLFELFLEIMQLLVFILHLFSNFETGFFNEFLSFLELELTLAVLFLQSIHVFLYISVFTLHIEHVLAFLGEHLNELLKFVILHLELLFVVSKLFLEMVNFLSLFEGESVEFRHFSILFANEFLNLAFLLVNCLGGGFLYRIELCVHVRQFSLTLLDLLLESSDMVIFIFDKFLEFSNGRPQLLNFSLLGLYSDLHIL
mmetsp:Transcript_2012/g.7237  ORF Transcript_2012/g.7237 Transcript_2012/m.7237 type:complete len:235 (+) Transcript_2012:3395-4099(+)